MGKWETSLAKTLSAMHLADLSVRVSLGISSGTTSLVRLLGTQKEVM